jgi:hypothetical protein
MTARKNQSERGKKGGRVGLIAVRVSDEEQLELERRAQAAGLPVGGYLRACALGKAGPRARRAPTIEASVFRDFTAALRDVARNLERIARPTSPAPALEREESARLFASVGEILARVIELVGRER